MRVTAVLPGLFKEPGAIEIYRIVGAYMVIRNKTRHYMEYLSSKTLRGLTGSNTLEGILESDIIVIQRMIAKDWRIADGVCQVLKSKGAKLVYETDDDLTGIFRLDPSGGTCMPYLPYCDAFTTSTQPLADQLSELTGAPSYVIPNYLPVAWFKQTSYKESKSARRQRRYPGTLNIMLVGTPTHDEDWRVITDLIPGLLRDYPNVRFLFGGHKPGYILDGERINHVPPCHFAAYPAMLFEADIICAGVVPDDHFNKAKSHCKALESWAAKRKLADGKFGGAAFIGTKDTIYDGTVKDGEDGLLVPHTHEAWDKAIRTLIEDDVFRRKLQRRGHSKVGRYSITGHHREWVSAYTQILRS